MTGPLTLLKSADLLGRYRYVELRCARALVRDPKEDESPVVTVASAVLSRSHSWRARLFEELLPISAGLPTVEECTRPPNATTEEIFALLDELERSTVLVVMNNWWYPAMLASYVEHVRLTSPVCDGPIQLNLVRASRDLQFSNDDLTEALAGFAPPLLEETERLEGLLVRSGGPFGPVLVEPQFS